jgi:hypothetical protein
MPAYQAIDFLHAKHWKHLLMAGIISRHFRPAHLLSGTNYTRQTRTELMVVKFAAHSRTGGNSSDN